jgi:hypothetical protein
MKHLIVEMRCIVTLTGNFGSERDKKFQLKKNDFNITTLETI